MEGMDQNVIEKAIARMVGVKPERSMVRAV
jgi:hypothetical protein